MTPARLNSCLRLLRGVTIQADINDIALRSFVAKRNQLESDMKYLATLMGEERFADRRLLVAMQESGSAE